MDLQSEHAAGPYGRPVVFEMPIMVTDEHVAGPGRHVNNVVYVRWIQDVATAPWETAAAPDYRHAVVWYVVRHEIDYLREAFAGDRLLARTHVGEVRGARIERFVDITRDDGTLAVRARTIWAAISSSTGRPTRITPAMIAPFFHS